MGAFESEAPFFVKTSSFLRIGQLALGEKFREKQVEK